ncbi:hypothetical protein [Lysinibacillus sp. NPDC092081]|uniref:hypothetical protein n=1 Tax=Lysinibacillus sp. NPDC092081 TaxID=3364131 RepID=UPI00380333FB
MKLFLSKRRVICYLTSRKCASKEFFFKLAHKKIRHVPLQDKNVAAQEAASWAGDSK